MSERRRTERVRGDGAVMKICVLGLRGIPDVMGGVETHCEQLFPLLKRMRPDDSFIIIARRGYLGEKKRDYMGLHVIGLAHTSSRRFETITNALYGVIYAKFVVNADLLHVQGIGPALVLPLAKLFGLKIVVTYHSKNYEQAKWGRAARMLLRIGERFAVWLSDHLITVSAVLAKDLSQRFPRSAKKITFIPNGADHLDRGRRPDASESPLERFELKEHAYIVAVGRLVPEKRFHDLVDAFCMATLRNDYKLAIVGEADHPDEYSRHLRAQAARNVIFTGHLKRESIQELLRNASLFVLPSACEGMPIAALEAIMAGCPVLMSDIEANCALGLPARNYFPLGSVKALRDKIESDHASYKIDNSEFITTYGWDSVCGRTNRIYSAIERDLLRGTKGRRLSGQRPRAFGPR